jgi:hypothetical protein
LLDWKTAGGLAVITDLIWNWFNHHREHPDLVPHRATHRLTFTWRTGRVQMWDVMWCRVWDTITMTEEWHGYTAEQWQARGTSTWAHFGKRHESGEHLFRRDGRFGHWHGELVMFRLDGTGDRLVETMVEAPSGTRDLRLYLDRRVRVVTEAGETISGVVRQGEHWDLTGQLDLSEDGRLLAVNDGGSLRSIEPLDGYTEAARLE